jgi:DNA-binding response OmpR family regulator
MPKILLAGSDSRLLATRAAVLSKTGAAVVFHNAIETLEVLDRDKFDLVVLCHSLTEREATVIADKVHQRIPGTKILMVTSGVDQYEVYPHRNVDATTLAEPVKLIARTMELLQVTSHPGPAKGGDSVVHPHLVLD